MKKRYIDAFACSVVILLATAFTTQPARASQITAPAGIGDFTAYAGWEVGCEFEPGCGGFSDDGSQTTNFLNLDGLTSYLLLVSSTFGTDFSYGEVDSFSVADQAYDIPVDHFLYNNNPFQTGPVTFSFENEANDAPASVSSLGTTLYNYSPFTATVTAYNSLGQVLGLTTFDSVENDNELYNFGSTPTYSAFVGVQHIDVNDIASVVISTAATDGSDNFFGIGTLGVTVVPEPGTPGLMLFGAAIVLFKVSRRA